MNRDYTIVPVRKTEQPLILGTAAARKAILKHEVDEDDLWRGYRAWERDCRAKAEADATDYSHFLNGTAAGFLVSEKAENKVFSPFSVFHALVAMASLTAGETRREILSALGLPDCASAEAAISLQYQANFAQGAMTVKPSAMLWLDERVKADRAALQALAERVFVGASQGRMSDTDFQRAMARWLSESTGGTFDERGNALSTDEGTRLILLTTLCYRDKWRTKFNPHKTEAGTFHAWDGAIRVPYMKKTLHLMIWQRDDFTAMPLDFEGDNTLWFILPREDIGPEMLLREHFFTIFPPDYRQTKEYGFTCLYQGLTSLRTGRA